MNGVTRTEGGFDAESSRARARRSSRGTFESEAIRKRLPRPLVSM
jgi:hypothetical protein